MLTCSSSNFWNSVSSLFSLSVFWQFEEFCLAVWCKILSTNAPCYSHSFLCVPHPFPGCYKLKLDFGALPISVLSVRISYLCFSIKVTREDISFYASLSFYISFFESCVSILEGTYPSRVFIKRDHQTVLFAVKLLMKFSIIYFVCLQKMTISK